MSSKLHCHILVCLKRNQAIIKYATEKRYATMDRPGIELDFPGIKLNLLVKTLL